MSLRLLAIGDLHTSKKKSIGRKEQNYWLEAVKPKLDFIFNQYHELKCDYFLCSGDLLDIPIVPDSIKSYFIKNDVKIIMTLGQHDLQTRDLTEDCSVSLLYDAGICEILSSRINNISINLDYGVPIYGCGYEEDIPEIKNQDHFNILLIHTLVSENDIWNKHVKFKTPKWFFKHTKYDLIISGDYHGTIIANKKNRYLLNSGSMMRKSVDQVNHNPCFFIVNINDDKQINVQQIFIPCAPFSDIMKLEEHIEKKKHTFDMANWKNELNRGDIKIDINFKETLMNEADKCEDEIKNFIYECLEKVGNAKNQNQ